MAIPPVLCGKAVIYAPAVAVIETQIYRSCIEECLALFRTRIELEKVSFA